MFAGAFERPVVESVTVAFERMIADQRAFGKTPGDHFANPGANDRVWNALEKLAVTAPEAFVAYYANDLLALAARSWLGPAYQVTSQVNVVNPGGAAQTAHRDYYHLGFQSDERCADYPPHVHELSHVLTLQGAVAHGDMPVESGPTKYLPHSQKHRDGYVAYRRPEVQDYFAGHVQLPLECGDAVFFNPALLHAAGSNRSGETRRMANLLQISSAFGRAMESIDRGRVVTAIYPALQAALARGLTASEVANVVAAGAEGYPFPTNLDRAQPVDGMSPPSQAEIVHQALRGGLTTDALATELGRQSATRLSH